MSFTYTTNIPFATHNPSNDQPLMEDNFNAINQWVGVDHVGFNTADQGEHVQVTFNNVTAQSTPTDPISILYTKNDAFNIPQLNFLNSSNFPNTASANGGVLLFAGIIIQWGSTGVVSDNATVTFANAFKHNCFQVLLTISDPNATTKTINVKSGSLTTTGFAVRVSTGSITASYLAIGN